MPDTQVLIIGAGVVGLSASLFLNHHGISSMVIERRSGTSIHPRARSVNQRTVELFSHLGIDELVHEAGKSIANSQGIYSGRSLKEVIEPKPRAEGKREFPLAGLAAAVSPSSGTFITQDMLEPVLVDTAKERGVDVRFDYEYRGVEQNDEGVTALIADRRSGEVSKFRANYLIAADGAKSRIRNELKVPTTGRGAMGHLVNVLFRADLADFVRGREFSLCKVERPEVHGLFTSINNSDRWVFHLSYDPSKGENASDFTEARCKELLQIATGMPDLEIEIESTLPWEPSVNVAEQLQHGRVFLAGDAAHQMPPWGGQGATSGISDAHNLAWKIAAVLEGKASEQLLETYDVERLPVGAYAAETSAAGADERGILAKPSLTTIPGLLRKALLVAGFGYGYKSRAICEESTWPFGGLTWIPWTIPSLLFSLDGRPGRRAPHVWAESSGKKISTIDMLGKKFVLLSGNDGDVWKKAAKVISLSSGIAIEAYTVGPKGDLVTLGKEFEAAAGIASNGAILVRPDDYVAWRQRRLPSNPSAMLDSAIRQVLCRPMT